MILKEMKEFNINIKNKIKNNENIDNILYNGEYNNEISILEYSIFFEKVLNMYEDDFELKVIYFINNY
jgi:hypothetical protein